MNKTVNVSDSAAVEKMNSEKTTASSRRVLATLSSDVSFDANAPVLAEETEL